MKDEQNVPSDQSPPVSADTYDENWIKTAWGEGGHSALTEGGTLQPRPRVSHALKLCNLESCETILDIACGRGEIPLICSSHGVRGYGIDFSSSALNYAQTLSKELKKQNPIEFQNCYFTQADATTLPFSDESFDRITMLDIIEHLTPSQLDSMFREAFRLLKPDGYIVLHTLPNRWVYNIGYRICRLLWPKLPKDPRSEVEKKIHINEQDIVGLCNTLTQSGLKNKIWLEQLIPAQARFQNKTIKYSDNRGALYPKLAGILGRILEMLSATPLKLILSNDIYGIAWKSESSPNIKLPSRLTEKFIFALSPKERKVK